MDKVLFGPKVYALEKYFGKPLETIINDLDSKGFSYKQQAMILRTKESAIISWRRIMKLPAIKYREIDFSLDDLCYLAGLRRPSPEDTLEIFETA